MNARKRKKKDICCCGHHRSVHGKYFGNAVNRKDSRFVCQKDGCSKWNSCDLEEL